MPMDILKHKIKQGKYEGLYIEEILSKEDAAEFITKYIPHINNAEDIRGLNLCLKSIIFDKKMKELEELVVSFYDSKMKTKKKDSFYDTYLEYLSYRYTGKNMNTIKESYDLNAAEIIIKTLKELR